MSSGPWSSTQIWKLSGRRVVALLPHHQISGHMKSPRPCTLDWVLNPTEQGQVKAAPGSRTQSWHMGVWEGVVPSTWDQIPMFRDTPPGTNPLQYILSSLVELGLKIMDFSLLRLCLVRLKSLKNSPITSVAPKRVQGKEKGERSVMGVRTSDASHTN